MARHRADDKTISRRSILAATPACGLALWALKSSDLPTASASPVEADLEQTVLPVDIPSTEALPAKEYLTLGQYSLQTAPQQPSRAPSSASPWRQVVLLQARKLIGLRYVWGGTSPRSGMDCSGYTQYVYRKAGIRLPRVAHDQMNALRHTTQPRPADLVFFLDERGYAYHCGVYAGNGQMFDAPHTGSHVQRQAIWSARIRYATPR